MKNFKEILIEHIKKYPLMQPQDVVKLCYQNEYGPAHLGKDKNILLMFLKEEYNSIYHNENEELYEDIGNGLVRINLHAYNDSLEDLIDKVLSTNKIMLGNHISFEYKIQIAYELLDQNLFCFSKADFENYIEEYSRMSYPIVGHSKIYKENYHPSYRVIKKEL